MTRKPTLLADVAELSNVLRAMDEWEAASGDLHSADGRRCFVNHLDDDAAEELAGLALTNLVRRVLEEKVTEGETGTLGEDTYAAAAPDPFPRPRAGRARAAA
jgi:hypothetical protein